MDNLLALSTAQWQKGQAKSRVSIHSGHLFIQPANELLLCMFELPLAWPDRYDEQVLSWPSAKHGEAALCMGA